VKCNFCNTDTDLEGIFMPEYILVRCSSCNYTFGRFRKEGIVMKFRCVKCQVAWGEGNPETEGYSHGLCLPCLRETLMPTVHRKQVREGNFDCFGSASVFCDQLICKYRGVCLHRPDEPSTLAHHAINQSAVQPMGQQQTLEMAC